MPRLLLSLLSVFIMFGLLSACSAPKEPVRIAINPWPGYEFLYLAEQQGFFKEVGLNAELVQLGSLSDAQRSYINGYVDGLASTVIEAVQSHVLSDNPLQIVLLPDFSNGGDVIVSPTSIESIRQLEGKTVGAEVSSLGLYFIQRALDSVDMELSDIYLINVEQTQGGTALSDGSIAAFMTYPPVSIELLRDDNYHTIFSSADIPGEIIDTIAISVESLNDNPGFVPKLHQVWNMALDFYEQNPQQALQIMAEREGISPDEFQEALQFMEILPTERQLQLRDNSTQLNDVIDQVCRSLVNADSIDTDCSQLTGLIYQGSLLDE